MKMGEIVFLSAVGVLLVASCQPGSVLRATGNPAAGGESHFGFVQVALTDNPVVGLEELNVCIERVDLVFADDRDIASLPVATTVNLLDLRGGVARSLGVSQFPVGTIVQVRLILCPDGASANIDGVEHDVTIPSGEETGLKLLYPGGFDIRENVVTTIVLDFDAERSLHDTGHGLMLTPVVQVVEAAILLAVTSPSPGAYVKPAPTVTGTVASREPLASLSVNGVPATVTGVEWSVSLTLAEGSNTITVKALDELGRSAAIDFEVTIDGTPPSVAIVNPAAQVVGAVWLQVTATDNSGVSDVRFIIDGSPVVTLAAPPFVALWDSGLVANGSHDLRAVAVDLAGNEASVGLPITVSNPPGFVVSSVEPVQGSPGTLVTVRGKASRRTRRETRSPSAVSELPPTWRPRPPCGWSFRRAPRAAR